MTPYQRAQLWGRAKIAVADLAECVNNQRRKAAQARLDRLAAMLAQLKETEGNDTTHHQE